MCFYNISSDCFEISGKFCPERSSDFHLGLGVKTASSCRYIYISVSNILAVAPTKTARPSGYRIGLKKYYAPGNANLGLD